jgi:NDP-sugar pyrophosphorylase family protein
VKKEDGILAEAMILAAGLGTRLKDLTVNTPKCLVNVGGYPMLKIVIERLKQSGVNHIVINTHYLADQIKDYLKSNKNFGLQISLSEEEDLLNTGGGLKKAEKLFSGSLPIIIHNADIYCDLDLKNLVNTHITSSNLATLVTNQNTTDRMLLFDEQGQLAGWENKSNKQQKLIDNTVSILPTKRNFCGIQCISTNFFNFLASPAQKESLIDGYLRAAESGNSVKEYLLAPDTIWTDIGTKKDLLNINQMIESSSKDTV